MTKEYYDDSMRMDDAEKLFEQIKAECGGCTAWSGTDCTRDLMTEGCLKDLSENSVCLSGDMDIPAGVLKASAVDEPAVIKLDTDIKKYESVDHPNHYHPGDYEAIKVIEAWLGPEGCYHFCMGNAIKYISRLDKKPSAGKSKNEKTIEDIGKTIWYLEYAKKMKSKMQ